MSAEEVTKAPTSFEELVPKMELRGTVKRIELFGAFVDIGIGQDGLLHISQLGKPNVRNVGDIVKEGEEITVFVIKVEPDTRRVALSLVKPAAVTWDDLKEGITVKGTVVRVENFGAFVDIGAERPGMVHVSELTTDYVNSPSDVVKVGQEVEAKIIKLNRKKRQIDLSIKALAEPLYDVNVEEEQEAVPTAMELALRRAMQGMDDDSGVQRGGKRDRRDRQVREQDDIIARTLKHHQS